MGLGLAENAEETYSFIANNYVDNDEIFILGFSRGAYTARFVAGLLGIIGILSRVGMVHFKPIVAVYKAAKDANDFNKAFNEYMAKNMTAEDWRLKKDQVNIKAVACWETVGAMGVPENMLASTLKLNQQWKFLDTQLPLRKFFLAGQ